MKLGTRVRYAEAIVYDQQDSFHLRKPANWDIMLGLRLSYGFYDERYYALSFSYFGV